MSKVLITGGGGFIGSRLAQRLVENHDVTVIDQRHASIPGAKFVVGDIADPDLWSAVDASDFVFHAAAFTSAVESETNPHGSYRTNVQGTEQVAAYARKHGARVIFCSSIRVYSPPAVAEEMKYTGAVNESCRLVREDHADQPPFAHHKVAAEALLLAADAQTGGVISHRMSSIVGPGQKGRQGHGWISYLVHCAVNRIPYTVFGDGNQVRDPLHVDDFVYLVRMELSYWDSFHKGAGSAYNVGGGLKTALSVNDAIRILKDRHQLRLNVTYGPERLGEPKDYVADTRAIEACGWSPRHTSPEQLITEMVESARST